MTRITFLKKTVVCGMMIVSVGAIVPLRAQAAMSSDMASQLQAMQQTLRSLQAMLLGKVAPAPLTAGVGTTITVSNDQQLFDALSSVIGGETIALEPV